MALTILADDLTGACDTGACFAGKSPVPVTVWPGAPADAPIRVVDTETRAVAAADAAARVRTAAESTRADDHFKKIDSTLRGHVAVEVEAAMAALGARTALVCPAFPAQRRVVVDRVLLVNGAPLPGIDGARLTVLDLLRPHLEHPLAWVPLPEVRGGVEALARRLGRLAGTVAVADAETDADLAALVDAAFAADPVPLLVGAAGLGRALAARLGLLAERATVPRGRRWLIVAGSRHPATREQVAAARAVGMTALTTGDADAGTPVEAAARLASEARERLEREPFDLVVVTGGDTALALYRALDAERVDLVGAPRPGLALGYLRAPRHPSLPLLTKAGGFGDPDLLVSLAREAAA
jgi:uncharacterized protein YgbK (DUF1537 family)